MKDYFDGEGKKALAHECAEALQNLSKAATLAAKQQSTPTPAPQNDDDSEVFAAVSEVGRPHLTAGTSFADRLEDKAQPESNYGEMEMTFDENNLAAGKGLDRVDASNSQATAEANKNLTGLSSSEALTSANNAGGVNSPDRASPEINIKQGDTIYNINVYGLVAGGAGMAAGASKAGGTANAAASGVAKDILEPKTLEYKKVSENPFAANALGAKEGSGLKSLEGPSVSSVTQPNNLTGTSGEMNKKAVESSSLSATTNANTNQINRFA